MLDNIPDLSNVIDSLGSEAFPAQLIKFFHRDIKFDGFVVLGYPASGELAVYHDGVPEAEQISCTPIYREGMWLFSPLYLHAKRGSKGFFHISDICDPHFKSSEFYAKYYSITGIHDQVAYIANNAAGEAIVISIERSSSLPPFSTDEQRALREVEPIITSLVCKHWPDFKRSSETQRTFKSNGLGEITDLIKAINLTPREEEALLALLKGLPNKLIARELGISVETVKVYVKNITRKFGINTRGELFAKILELIVNTN